MEMIRKQYIIDESNRKVAVQIPIDVYEKLEEILENYGLIQLMKENEATEVLSVNEAKSYYNGLEKAQ
jgi:ribosome maturation protein Sdo1